MSIAMKKKTLSIGTGSVLALETDMKRQYLKIQNKHGSQTVTVSYGAPADSNVAEVQLITFTNVPTAGTYKVGWNGALTAAIAYNDNAAAVQAALRLVTGLSAVTVSGNTTIGFSVTMTSVVPIAPLGDADLPLLTVSDFSTLQIALVPEQQTITASAEPASGTYKLNYGGNATAAIAWDANAAAVQAALRLVSGLSAVTVAGSFATAFTVTFAGVDANAALLTVTDNSLEDVTPVAVNLVVAETVAGVPHTDTSVTVTQTTVGTYASGMVLAAGIAQEFPYPDNCPVDAVYLSASGSDTRVELNYG